MRLYFFFSCSNQTRNEESKNARKNLKPLILNQVSTSVHH